MKRSQTMNSWKPSGLKRNASRNCASILYVGKTEEAIRKHDAMHKDHSHKHDTTPAMAPRQAMARTGTMGARRWQASPLPARETQGELAASARHLPVVLLRQAGIGKLAFLMPPL